MFDNLGEKLQATFKKLTGKGKLSEKDIDAALREIRMSLLEADVNFKVVKGFLSDVRERAMGSDVFTSLTPGQTMVKIVYEAMSDLLGGSAKQINFGNALPLTILMAGVQGSGKTTSAAKLALFYKKKNKRVLVAACDVKRAAAVEQLGSLLNSIGVPMFSLPGADPVEVAAAALKQAKAEGMDLLIVDTAGRQHVDEELMEEISRIAEAVHPSEALFAIDCMMGQQAVDSASAFDEAVKLTGFILTKADSDARGGAALSVSYITGRPIKFAGTGEKLNDFEVFHPDRIASRILGMGDMLTLIEKAQDGMDEEAAKAAVEKLEKNAFTLEDYLTQIEQISEMGGIEEVLRSIPGIGKLGPLDTGEEEMAHTKAIILSMTPKERQNPSIINASRRRRIARGSGMEVSDVNRLLRGFEQSKKLMKQFSGKKGKQAFGKLNFPFSF